MCVRIGVARAAARPNESLYGGRLHSERRTHVIRVGGRSERQLDSSRRTTTGAPASSAFEAEAAMQSAITGGRARATTMGPPATSQRPTATGRSIQLRARPGGRLIIIHSRNFRPAARRARYASEFAFSRAPPGQVSSAPTFTSRWRHLAPRRPVGAKCITALMAGRKGVSHDGDRRAASDN